MVKVIEKETSYERHLLSKFFSCAFTNERFFLSQSQAVCIFTVTPYYGGLIEEIEIRMESHWTLMGLVSISCGICPV